ncbi:MAG: mechanosensitive ion channel [Cryomorphaceae bacterium]
MREILNFKLLDLEDYQITVFTIGLVAVILLGTYLSLKIVKRSIVKPSKGLPSDGGRRHSIFLIIRYLVWVVSIVLCMQTLGIQLNLLLAGSAALLVGLGLGIQQIFNDIVSGMFLLFEGSVQIDDILEVDGLVCMVREINLRTSKVETRDDIMVIIPNHVFINEKVINWSHQHKITRFRIEIGVSYKSDPAKVRDILLEIMKAKKGVIKSKDKGPAVRFNGFGDSSLDFEMLFYSPDTFRIENIMSDMRFEVFRRFKEEGIEIPFPQRDVHFRSSDINLPLSSDAKPQ